MRTLAAAAAVAALMLLAGCGGQSESDAVRIAQTWVQAVQHGEDTAACKLMTDRATKLLAARLHTPPDDCGKTIAAYRDSVGASVFSDIASTGLQANGKPKDGKLGVFPKSGPYQFQVILMQNDGSRWAVLSSGVR